MSHVNYKSDFSRKLRLKDLRGKDIGWPGYDWSATFWAYSRNNAVTVSCIGGICTNCINDGGALRAVFNSHSMGYGRLKVEFTAELPDANYPDGMRRIVQRAELRTELTPEQVCCGCDDEETIILPIVIGESSGGHECCPPEASWDEVAGVIDGLFGDKPGQSADSCVQEASWPEVERLIDDLF